MRTKILLLLGLVFLSHQAIEAQNANKSASVLAKLNYIQKRAELENSMTLSGRSPAQSVSEPARTPVFTGLRVGLSGFFDYQTYDNHYIYVNPNNRNEIRVIYNLSDLATDTADATVINANRRVGYALSTNGGTSWQTNQNVPNTALRCSYPSLTVFGPTSTVAPLLPFVSYYGPSPDFQPFVFAGDDPAGITLTSTAMPTVPNALYTELGNNGSQVFFAGGVNPNNTITHRIFNGATWSGALPFNLDGDTVRSQDFGWATSASNGRTSFYVSTTGIGISTAVQNPVTSFPSAITRVVPNDTTVAGDSLTNIGAIDGVYSGEELHLVWTQARVVGGAIDGQKARIWHWSPSTGVTEVINARRLAQAYPFYDSTKVSGAGLVLSANIDGPSIGVATNGNLYAVFQAATRDTAVGGRNYYNIFYTVSANNGRNWSTPIAIEGRNEDFRFPSISKFCQAGVIDLVYQQDNQPGSHLPFGDGAPFARAQLLFKRITTLNAANSGTVTAKTFALSQNYPNPFNPSTSITYTLPVTAKTTLRVFDIIGREVATLVDGVEVAGTRTVNFNAANLASGVYFYKLQSGAFTETKKMMLVK
jgi:hypothetical protein